MAILNRATAPTLTALSRPTLGALAGSERLQATLAPFCPAERIGLVPTDAFTDGTKTGRWLLDRLREPIAAGLRMLADAVAVRRQPTWLGAAFRACPWGRRS